MLQIIELQGKNIVATKASGKLNKRQTHQDYLLR